MPSSGTLLDSVLIRQRLDSGAIVMASAMDLALFDFDGTISHNDCFTPFIYFASSPQRLALIGVVLAPQILAYRLGLMSAGRMRTALVAIAFGGCKASAVERLGQEYADEVLDGCVRELALRRIHWHQRRGDKVVVVSASLETYLKPWCRKHNLMLIGTRLNGQSGVLSWRRSRVDCSGHEKVRRIREELQLDTFGEIYAYGDTLEDRQMLQLARRRFYRWQEIDSIPEE